MGIPTTSGFGMRLHWLVSEAILPHKKEHPYVILYILKIRYTRFAEFVIQCVKKFPPRVSEFATHGVANFSLHQKGPDRIDPALNLLACSAPYATTWARIALTFWNTAAAPAVTSTVPSAPTSSSVGACMMR